MNIEINNLNSLRIIIKWLSEKQHIKNSELKEVLLPLNYFPSVLIDQLNEESITLFDEVIFDEVIFDEDGDQFIINQELLLKLLTSIDEIDSLSSILDLTPNERSNNINHESGKINSSLESNSPQSMDTLSTAGDDTYEEALNYLMPYGKYPQNEKEAMRLLKKAASLGCLDAYIDIANIYIDGGPFDSKSKFAPNYEKAIDYYIAGANKGSIYCYYSMAILYAANLKDEANARKCFLLYVNKFSEISINSNWIISNENKNTIISGTCGSIFAMMNEDYKKSTLSIYHELVVEFSSIIASEVIKRFEEGIASPGGSARAVAALRYYDSYLQTRLIEVEKF